MNRPGAGGEFFCPTVALPFQARSVVGGTRPPIRLALVNRRLNVWERFIILGQVTIAAHETPDPSDARERGTDLTKNMRYTLT